MTDDEALRMKKRDIRRFYLVTDRDERLANALKDMAENFEDTLAGAGRKECALLVIGSSDSGKSTALARLFGELDEFKPRVGADGVERSPVLSVEMPSSCSGKAITAKVLTELNVPVRNAASDAVLTNLLQRILKERGIKFLHLDEAQHAVLSASKSDIQSVRDKLKSLAQIKDWPIQLIVSGTEPLAGLVEHVSNEQRELANRTHQFRFNDLTEKHTTQCFTLIERLVVELCQLDANEVKNHAFVSVLMETCNGSFGTIIIYLKEAAILAVERGDTSVRVRDFEDYYRRRSGRQLHENPFHRYVADSKARAVPPTETIVNIKPHKPAGRTNA